MKICVVGGTGNISTSIVRLLLAKGHEVICCNRGGTGELAEGARRMVCDRKDRPEFERMMQAERFDAAIDMICFNREDAESSLRAFRGVAHFVNCSTVCTYGVDYDWLPVTENHPLRPITAYGRNKVEADGIFLEAYAKENFPVTIIKPSTTYGPKMGLLRQLGRDFSWIDRVRKGKPILVCGDGRALHQFLHVGDAALCFVGVLGRGECLGRVYNMVRRGFVTWEAYHRAAMRVIGREVEMVGVPLADLVALEVPCLSLCREIFSHNTIYSSDALFRDVPEFRPSIDLEEGIRRVLNVMDAEGRIPDSDTLEWEDAILAAQHRVREARISYS